MSDSSQEMGSFIIPSSVRVGKFRCGVCWSQELAVHAATNEAGILIRIQCPSCGNAVTLQTEGAQDGNSN